jgi:hypothetical protein
MQLVRTITLNLLISNNNFLSHIPVSIILKKKKTKKKLASYDIILKNVKLVEILNIIL